MIEARILKGFRDFLPASEIERKVLTEKAENIFRMFGYVPIDTPALEYTDILLGKGGGETEKQIYRFKDNGGRDVALRFDLTVPFARFVALHKDDLCFPFKRYHIAKVWRGENTQRGRYREFTQCDFDCIGIDNAAADFEILFLIHSALLAVKNAAATIRVNHRGLFNRFLKNIGASEKSADVLRTVDKLAKIGQDEVQKQLTELLDAKRAKTILNYVQPLGLEDIRSIKPKESWEETLCAMTKAAGGEDSDTERLKNIRQFMIDTGTEDNFVLDPSITRGLDYYTGIVFETFLTSLPLIGSVCSGGRYDNLMGLYSKDALSGVGASIGLDRLIAALESLNLIESTKTYAKICIANLDETKTGLYQQLATNIRALNIPCEVLCEAKKQLSQFIDAEKKGASWVLLPSQDDPVNGKFTLRNLSARQNKEGLLVHDIKLALSSNE
ncbi:MAG: histidine--tRNA ligase [Termitinemataceae bacterium]|nr:MAG: histidine--tRNA ligase [Termitinemataceae bacterium]